MFTPKSIIIIIIISISIIPFSLFTPCFDLLIINMYYYQQVANFPDIVFPILWFEEGVDSLPDEILDLMKLATTVPPKAKYVLTIALFSLGGCLFLIAVICLVRKSHRQSTLHLEGSNYLASAAVDQAKKKAKMESGSHQH